MIEDLEHLSREQIATLLGVSVKSIDAYTKRADDPLLVHDEIGKFRFYKWSEALPWKLRFEVNKLPQKAFKAKDDLTSAKLEGQNLLNEKANLELQVRKGELLEAKDVEKTWADAFVDIRQSLVNVGHTVAIEITDGMSYIKKKRIIDTGIFAALNTVVKDALS
jgi:hypothetical protein